MVDPPPLPDTVRTPFYCEENVYLLCKAFLESAYQVSAVFISNEQKTVALWNQKHNDEVIVWDYHVVLLLRAQDGQSWIYDFDTQLPLPCPMKDYLHRTFNVNVVPAYQRVIPGATFIDHFASDRSHMVINPMPHGLHLTELQLVGLDGEQPVYQAPPPPYAPIRGKLAKEDHNLMDSFICMDSSGATFGTVYELDAMLAIVE